MSDAAAVRTRWARQTAVPGAAMVAVSFGLARYGYGLLLPEMRADLRLGAGAAGLISSGTYLSYLVANAATVWLASRFGARTSIALSAASAAGGMAVIATATSAAALAAGVLVAGAAAGLALPPYAGVVADTVPARRRDLAWSVISSGTGWGVALAGPLAIAAGGQWRLAWVIFVGIAVVVGAGAWRAARPRVSARSDAGADVREPSMRLNWAWFVCPRSGPLLVSAVLIGLGCAVWWSFCVDAMRAAGIGADTARVAYAACGAAGVVASGAGAVFARTGLRRGFGAAAVPLAGSLIGLAWWADVPGVAIVAAVTFGVSYNAIIAAQGIWSGRVFAAFPSAGLAAVNTALTIGTLAGPAVAGVLISTAGYGVALTFAGAAVAVAAVFRPPRDDQAASGSTSGRSTLIARSTASSSTSR